MGVSGERCGKRRWTYKWVNGVYVCQPFKQEFMGLVSVVNFEAGDGGASHIANLPLEDADLGIDLEGNG